MGALWPYLAVPWVGLRCVIVVFPDYTHLLFIGVSVSMMGCNLLCFSGQSFVDVFFNEILFQR